VIAHRLSTVVNSDQIIFIDNGRILARGTFESVRAEIPNFDEQAKLMGI
jgi:ABC-type multidrug transport system fused ATPase/permease subunit